MRPIEPAEPKAKSPQLPDSEDRIRDFWARHGGPSARASDAGEIVAGICGWSEVYAADGCALRCEWSQLGGRLEMQFIEKCPPGN